MGDREDRELEARTHEAFAVLRRQVVEVVEEVRRRLAARLRETPQTGRGRVGLGGMAAGFLLELVNLGTRMAGPLRGGDPADGGEE